MKRKLLTTTIVAIAGAFLFQGCGGGGSSSSTNVAEAKYYDSPVEGVGYKCGSQEGVTGVDGSFYFEVGQGCEFYIGDYKFKEISSAKLKKGEIIVEQNATIAAILQTLDCDGNPDNNITIKNSVAVTAGKVLAKHHSEINSNLDTVLNDIVVAIDSDPKAEPVYNGHIVSRDMAQKHLEKTLQWVQTHQDAVNEQVKNHEDSVSENVKNNLPNKEAQEAVDKVKQEVQTHQDVVNEQVKNHEDSVSENVKNNLPNKEAQEAVSELI